MGADGVMSACEMLGTRHRNMVRKRVQEEKEGRGKERCERREW